MPKSERFPAMMPKPEHEQLRPSRGEARVAKKTGATLEEAKRTKTPSIDEELEAAGLDKELDKLKDLQIEAGKPAKKAKAVTTIEAIAKETAEIHYAQKAQLGKLANANLEELPRAIKEARASLFLAGADARSKSPDERLAAGLTHLRESNPKRAEKIIQELSAFDFETKPGPSESQVAKLSAELKKRKDEQRREYVAPIQPKKLGERPKNLHEAKVIVQQPEEHAEVRDSEVELVEPTDEKKTEAVRERISHAAFESLSHSSENDRKRIDTVIQEVRTRLESDASVEELENEMNFYGQELGQLRDRLEKHQREAHLLTKTPETTSLMSENSVALEKVGQGLRASKMKIKDALSELTHGEKVRGHEQKKELAGRGGKAFADRMSKEIEATYGADPEALMAGKGPFFKSLLFRMKNTLSHLTRQQSEYDLYREARSHEAQGEIAQGEREMHEQRGGVSQKVREAGRAARAQQKVEREGRRAVAEADRKQDIEFAWNVLTQPKAAVLYEAVMNRMRADKEREPGDFTFSAEDYVLASAKFTDAVTNNRAGGIKEYGTEIDSMNKELDTKALPFDPKKEAANLRKPERPQEKNAKEMESWSEADMRKDPKKAVRYLPNAAKLWDHVTKEMQDMATELKMSGPEVTQTATDIVIKIALYRKLMEMNDTKAALRLHNETLKLADKSGLIDDAEIKKALN